MSPKFIDQHTRFDIFAECQAFFTAADEWSSLIESDDAHPERLSSSTRRAVLIGIMQRSTKIALMAIYQSDAVDDGNHACDAGENPKHICDVFGVFEGDQQFDQLIKFAFAESDADRLKLFKKAVIAFLKIQERDLLCPLTLRRSTASQWNSSTSRSVGAVFGYRRSDQTAIAVHGASIERNLERIVTDRVQRCWREARESFNRAVKHPHGPQPRPLRGVDDWLSLHSDADYELPIAFETWERYLRACPSDHTSESCDGRAERSVVHSSAI